MDTDADEEARLRLEKLRAELRLLEQQLSPQTQRLDRLKIIGGVGGVLAAVVALVGICVSIYQWSQNSAAEQNLRADERLDRGLSLLGAANESGRLAGVISMSSFLHQPDIKRKSQVLTAFAGALAFEPSTTVRNAIAAEFDEADFSDNSALLNRALASLVSASRRLTREASLHRARRTDLSIQPEPGSPEARAISISLAIVTLLRKGARVLDLSGTYLAGLDFSGLRLERVVFADAILPWANFTLADLENGSFANADLEGAVFHYAILRGVNFTQSDDLATHYNYLWAQMERASTARWRSIVYIDGPDFRCADLTNADFTGHALVLIGNIEIAAFFRNTQLRGAKLLSLKAVGVLEDDPVQGPIATGARPFRLSLVTYGLVPPGNKIYFIAAVPQTLAADDSVSVEMLTELAYRLQGAKWQQARLSSVLRSKLMTATPSTSASELANRFICEPKL